MSAPQSGPGSALDQVEVACRWLHASSAALWVGLTWCEAWVLLPPPRAEATDALPRLAAWTRWSALVALLAGVTLLFLVYYGPRTAYLTGAQAEPAAWLPAFLGLAAGFVVYDTLTRLPARWDPLLLAAFFGAALLFALGLEQRLGFSPRAALLHAGAFLATAMAGNVWLRPAGGENPTSRARRARHNALFSLSVVMLMVGVDQTGLFVFGVLPTLSSVFLASALAAALLRALSRWQGASEPGGPR